jgi:hypothetical protein
MAKPSRLLVIGLVMIVLTLAAGILNLAYRVEKLEKICHGLCKYGDDECAKRCAKAGHCEFVGMNE